MSVDLGVKVERLTRLDGTGSTKAYCDVSISGALVIKSFKVVDGKKGLFVSMPREQGKNGQWYDMVTPLTKEAREELVEAVLDAYSSNEPALS